MSFQSKILWSSIYFNYVFYTTTQLSPLLHWALIRMPKKSTLRLFLKRRLIIPSFSTYYSLLLPCTLAGSQDLVRRPSNTLSSRVDTMTLLLRTSRLPFVTLTKATSNQSLYSQGLYFLIHARVLLNLVMT